VEVKRRIYQLLFILFAVIALSLLYNAITHLQEQHATSEPPMPELDGIDTADLIGRPRPAFELADHDGRVYRAADWDGQVLVVNFWATWCVPCRREIPAFVALQDSYRDRGLQFVGIAIDTAGEVRRFVDELDLAVNYPLLIAADNDGIALATDYGNRFGILPYTVLVDRAGAIRFIQYGEISHAQTERAIRELL
jgi:peroxiredoxin